MEERRDGDSRLVVGEFRSDDLRRGFSWSYLSLSAGTGALILFGFVQATMYGWAVWSGERLRLGTWLGLAVASLGLITLSAPGIETTSSRWSSDGRCRDRMGRLLTTGTAVQPVLATAGNFRCGPLMLLLIPWVVTRGVYTNRGLLLAVISRRLLDWDTSYGTRH